MKEQISCLMDDELDDDATAEALDGMLSQQALAEEWRLYHLIGDELRRSPRLSPDFTARMRARLDAEPTVLLPAAARATRRRQSWGQGFLAAAAALSGIAAVTWTALHLEGGMGGASGAAVAASPAPAMQQERLAAAGSGAKDYLIAHQGYSLGSSLQGASPYIRAVSVVDEGK